MMVPPVLPHPPRPPRPRRYLATFVAALASAGASVTAHAEDDDRDQTNTPRATITVTQRPKDSADVCKTDPISANELIAAADRYRNKAIDEYNGTWLLVSPAPTNKANDSSTTAANNTELERRRQRFNSWGQQMGVAIYCYSRALKLSPEEYRAWLGLGTIYLIGAHMASDNNDRPTQDSYVALAKAHIARAYVSSAGSFEPLYFLADIATIEYDFERAQRFLGYLQRAAVMPDAVLMLSGFIAEKQGRSEDARRYYSDAIRGGASSELLGFLLQQANTKAVKNP